jgi:hypothetical protein
MGFNQSSSSSSSAFKASSVSKTDLFSAVLAGFGIWTTPSPATQQQPQPAASNVYPLHPPLPRPLRVIRVKDDSPQMAGRMVISGRMADVCAELDRLAA